MAPAQDRLRSRLRLMLLILAALACLWPLLRCWSEFKSLFFFEDEWDQLRQLDREGVLRWAFSTFGENFMPLCKLLWFGTLKLCGGRYFALILAVWLTHAVNAFLLGWLLVRRGGGLAGALLAMGLFGLSATIYETTGWSIQWSNVLALFFFLLALHWVERLSAETPPSARICAVLFLLLLASALCFVRGIFSGLALAGLMLTPWAEIKGWRRRALVGLLAALPAALVLGFMRVHAEAGVQHFDQITGVIFWKMAAFALHCYGRNPIVNWWNGPVPSGALLAGLIALKTAIFAAGLRVAPRQMKPLLATLILFELANDLALGLGRYHTGLGAAGSSRYQCTSLLVFAVFLGVLFDWLLGGLKRIPGLRPLAAALVLAVVVRAVARPWPGIMAGWQDWRGASLRAALALPPDKAPPHFSRLPWLSNDQIRALVEKYHLR